MCNLCCLQRSWRTWHTFMLSLRWFSTRCLSTHHRWPQQQLCMRHAAPLMCVRCGAIPCSTTQAYLRKNCCACSSSDLILLCEESDNLHQNLNHTLNCDAHMLRWIMLFASWKSDYFYIKPESHFILYSSHAMVTRLFPAKKNYRLLLST